MIGSFVSLHFGSKHQFKEDTCLYVHQIVFDDLTWSRLVTDTINALISFKQVFEGFKLTCFLTYQGYHGTFVFNLSCASAYLVAVTGTTESTSPLPFNKTK